MSQSATQSQAGGSPSLSAPDPRPRGPNGRLLNKEGKERAPRKSEIGKEKAKTQQCGCCKKMFVTLARHYRYEKMTREDGTVTKPSDCAAWAIANNIDAKSVSIAKNTDRVKALAHVKGLADLGIPTTMLMRMIDTKFPERPGVSLVAAAPPAEAAEEDEEEDDGDE